MQLRTRGHQFELPAVKCEFNNETLLFDRFLIMYNLCVVTCIIVISLYTCASVICIKLLLTYLLTYLLPAAPSVATSK